MSNRPKKPENYWRDYLIIGLIALIPVPVAIYFDIEYISQLLTLVIVSILPHLWFREYYSELLRYDKLNDRPSKPLISKKSQVNENIAQYLKEQNEKKAQAKWWQFGL
ncbi:hypothetical protein [uncultured Paraglaciecola sp.]|uniref:hypothetical protein n=1 Tax=uncultured Paraglaciecola sp. TaxID=1765024 RepID=UPI0025E6622B|nr:hypothetical protein [uncultured Paraglaciecola sp.]